MSRSTVMRGQTRSHALTRHSTFRFALSHHWKHLPRFLKPSPRILFSLERDDWRRRSHGDVSSLEQLIHKRIEEEIMHGIDTLGDFEDRLARESGIEACGARISVRLIGNLEAIRRLLMEEDVREPENCVTTQVVDKKQWTEYFTINRVLTHLAYSIAFSRKKGYVLGLQLVRSACRPHETSSHISSSRMMSISTDHEPPVYTSEVETVLSTRRVIWGTQLAIFRGGSSGISQEWIGA
ncbi:hypothetical protein EDC04DRAFT_2597672 [Pisolithus marmoratus]|nr:hypothetical protein EDC04DRAFT_2597672 [Pisolithus marmoratus]